MTIHLKQTGAYTAYRGAHAEIWRGTTDGGIEIIAFIAFTAPVHEEQLMELRERLADEPPYREIPLKMLIGADVS